MATAQDICVVPAIGLALFMSGMAEVTLALTQPRKPLWKVQDVASASLGGSSGGARR
jgi:hypothetical protein